MRVPVAIIVPVHGHSALVSEALVSALDLPDLPVIAVDDGCPDPQTKAALEGWALSAPDRFHRITQPNMGLSGARNTGIEFALKRYPGIEALFFLDADNRLDDHAHEAWAHLLKTQPDTDWFYPSFDMFGLDSNARSGATYAVPLMSSSNLCDAGSLVRRRVFDAGIRFDLSMKGGYEDWDFFLSASGAGFVGAPAGHSFLRYRKRPESMLSGAIGKDVNLRSRIRDRHQWLYARDHVAQLSAGIMDQTILLETGSKGLCRFTDPDHPNPTSETDEIARFYDAAIRPLDVWRPRYWAVARPGAMDALRDAGLIHSAIWYLRRALQSGEVAALNLARNPQSDIAVTLTDPIPFAKGHAGDKRSRMLGDAARIEVMDRERQALVSADILMVSANALERRLMRRGGQVRDAVGWLLGSRVTQVRMEIPDPPVRSGADPMIEMGALIGRIANHPRHNSYHSELVPWRDDAEVASPRNIDRIVRSQTFGGQPLPIRAADAAIRIGFVLPIFHFGGVEKCVVALARSLRAQGVQCYLFVYGTDAVAATPWLTEPFETLHILTDPGLRDWQGSRYIGTNMASEPSEVLYQDMLAPLTGMDAVIMSGSAALCHGLAGLREKGILTVSWEHLLETGVYGRPYGTPYLALAYEGGFDLILSCSDQLKSWLYAQGIPEKKLLALPNGPGFPVAEDQVAADLSARAEYSGPLRVGFLGRLDRQKGLDRFLAVADACRGDGIEFSITGKSVIGDSDIRIPDWIETHPTAFGIDELRAAFARIDVLLMPSRDEGLPLTIMEAQRAGVIPVATDVGAVAEAIRGGETGILLEPGGVVDQAVTALRRLAAEPETRRRIATSAGEKPGSWDRNAERLLDRLRSIARRREVRSAFGVEGDD